MSARAPQSDGEPSQPLLQQETARAGFARHQFGVTAADRERPRGAHLPAEAQRLAALLANCEFGVLEARVPFALARRGHADGNNAAALERLGGR